MCTPTLHATRLWSVSSFQTASWTTLFTRDRYSANAAPPSYLQRESRRCYNFFLFNGSRHDTQCVLGTHARPTMCSRHLGREEFRDKQNIKMKRKLPENKYSDHLTYVDLWDPINKKKQALWNHIHFCLTKHVFIFFIILLHIRIEKLHRCNETSHSFKRQQSVDNAAFEKGIYESLSVFLVVSHVFPWDQWKILSVKNGRYCH